MHQGHRRVLVGDIAQTLGGLPQQQRVYGSVRVLKLYRQACRGADLWKMLLRSSLRHRDREPLGDISPQAIGGLCTALACGVGAFGAGHQRGQITFGMTTRPAPFESLDVSLFSNKTVSSSELGETASLGCGVCGATSRASRRSGDSVAGAAGA